jgi:DNA repair protein RadC
MPADPSNVTIHDLPDDERPRERLLQRGAAALSAVELLAIILHTGTTQENVLHLAERVLTQFGGLAGLASATVGDLEQIKGLGGAKTAQILAALELGRRVASRPSSERPVIADAADAARLVSDMADLTQEHIRVILLDNGRRVIAVPTVYIGTLNTSVLRVSEIFREAIARNSAAVVIAHNHPSGDPTPSPEDVEVTRALDAAGSLLDITVLDHIIIGGSGWRSLRELGLGFR